MRRCRVHEWNTDGGRKPGPARKSSLQGREALQQVVFQNVASRCGSGGDPQFAVDRAHMRIDGDLADDELCGNLSAGQPLSKQAQDLHLSYCQPCGIAKIWHDWRGAAEGRFFLWERRECVLQEVFAEVLIVNSLREQSNTFSCGSKCKLCLLLAPEGLVYLSERTMDLPYDWSFLTLQCATFRFFEHLQGFISAFQREERLAF